MGLAPYLLGVFVDNRSTASGALPTPVGTAVGLTYGLVAVVVLLSFPVVDSGADLLVSDAVVSTLPRNLVAVASAFLVPLAGSDVGVLYSAFSGPAQPSESY